MKKTILVLAVLLLGINANAQLSEKELLEKNALLANKADDTTNAGWKRGGNIVFLFNQSAFNNDWLGGGTANTAGNLGLNYDFNYKAEKIVWDNKIIAAYGLTQTKGQKTTKSDDRLEFTSLLGRKAGQGYWYYSWYLNAKTQMDSGFDKAKGIKISHFFSPAYLQSGPGMLWKKSNNLKVNIAPATSRLIFVDGQFTQSGAAFGVAQGKTSRFEFGAALNGYYKLNLMENISVENILNLYSNYLDRPKNVDIDYQMNLVMKVNKYISTNLAFQALYDDNARGAFQIREVFGLGVNYGF
ncbi:DUF3078 domain-containing protein [Flavobacterium psychrophilum]|jgi:hypothetical protein|uniref:DUF3078 domain-containing protein n=1 Tax=Flavobacterium psychrophilum TaxID=96345 RepID=UPI000156DCA7|nr:DUF3078 domain-containing protein [Flavobacterium psychrophilum]AIG31109.1 hypothetical protein IA03_11825 [Flavobacterium psychrophilum]AIG33386.1 hypothetical protein IA01_11855 [Flavobacterium psychrophilum]AIG35536.1 hypothetical protein IA02_11230 [Flavobacterium psychrophilum]AIG37897.1 hypothetical protein IA04_11710 [Flavobacterium psychrophilum]AIG40168.1 hypothetical protein IA05_11830 [Flavobacterium psychrophilum]